MMSCGVPIYLATLTLAVISVSPALRPTLSSLGKGRDMSIFLETSLKLCLKDLMNSVAATSCWH